MSEKLFCVGQVLEKSYNITVWKITGVDTKYNRFLYGLEYVGSGEEDERFESEIVRKYLVLEWKSETLDSEIE